MRKCPAVPDASALLSCHVPLMLLEPEAAFAIQSAGRFSVASTVPESAVAHDAGAAPVRMRRMAEAPMAVSMASRRALRTSTENWMALSDYSL